MFLAQRQLQAPNPETSPQSENQSTVPHNSDLPAMLHNDSLALQISGMGGANVDANANDDRPARRISVSTFSSGSSDRDSERSGPATDSDGWQVQSYGIKKLDADCQSASLARRLKDLIDHESFSPQLIEELLIKQLSDQPLGPFEATPFSDQLLIMEPSDQPLGRQKTSWSNVDRYTPIDRHASKEQPSELSLDDVAGLTDSSLPIAGDRERRNSTASVSTCSSLEGIVPKDIGNDTESPATKMAPFAGKECKLLSSAHSAIALRRQRRSAPACAEMFVTI
jgi:hypothetical protein